MHQSWTAEELFARAKQMIFSMGVEDSAAQLCAANMAYGLAKINFALVQLGYPPDACFIATPDMTITRNTGRWRAGFGYGGKIQWGWGDRPLIVLDVKPNGCGMLVGGLTDMPDPQSIIRRLNELQQTPLELQGVKISWDFGKGNHFIDLCVVQPIAADISLPPYMFVIHGSCPELHQESALGPGLYWDASETLRQQARRLLTPWGPLHILLDEAAWAYWTFWQTADAFAKERRLIAARHCFPDFQMISNTTHQGLLHPNAILLGCHDSQPPDNCLLPIMVRSDLPGYLFAGLPNLSEAVIDSLGFRPRAEQLGVLSCLQKANIIPHGSGYSLPHLVEVRRVWEWGERRYFEMSTAQAGTTELIEDLHDVQQKYRGRQPVLKTLECGLGKMISRLTPLHFLKA